MTEAMYYEKEKGHCLCKLCPHFCNIAPGKLGLCRVRRNIDSVLYAESYGKLSSMAIDPIEKKPLLMFADGVILSVGSYGCNFRCGFCQNHEISMAGPTDGPELHSVPPEILCQLAIKYVPQGNLGVAYTYNEPFISYEYMYDSAKLCHEHGLKNVVVTNGFVNLPPLQNILPYIDAMNIDLKSFSADFYKNIGGSIEPVKRSIETAQKSCHVEVTTLIIPGENDSPEQMEELACWLASVNENIPLHITRFRPRYKMSHIPAAELLRTEPFALTARKYLKNVFCF